jgi:hypothetical protein
LTFWQRYQPWCYLCMMGDPHDVHLSPEAYFGVQRTKEVNHVTSYAPDPLGARRARLQREIREAQLQLDALEFVPTEDSYADGTVIRAQILNPGKRDPLTYLFLKVADPAGINSRNPSAVRWYHTGWVQRSAGASRGNSTYFNGWPELQTWLTEPRRVVESWEILTPRCELNHADPTPRTSAGRSHESIHADVLDVLRAEYGFTAPHNISKPFDPALDHQLSELAHKILRVDGVL